MTKVSIPSRGARAARRRSLPKRRVRTARIVSFSFLAILALPCAAIRAAAPAAPSALTAAPVSTSRIDLAWADRSSNETGFKIDRRRSGTDPWVRVAQPGANVTRWIDTGLPEATHFYYKVKAYNASG
ncbi:MAG: fibronectin type III domain-containing protein, partial [Kiritimatiellae bacterium]|nr:fibronectin type III domain-containing protein [Kiritimatiellia bacterium]